MNEIKVVFLDIDGVLITARSVLANVGVVENLLSIPDPVSVGLLNRVLVECDAKIVLTSTHRKQYITDKDSLAKMAEHLTKLGVRGDLLIGYTSVLRRRGQEIQDWLSKNNVTQFVVLDDASSAVQAGDGSVITELKDCFIQSDSRTGITEQDYRDMRVLLGNPDNGVVFL